MVIGQCLVVRLVVSEQMPAIENKSQHRPNDETLLKIQRAECLVRSSAVGLGTTKTM